jgi:hypothetical protein
MRRKPINMIRYGLERLLGKQVKEIIEHTFTIDLKDESGKRHGFIVTLKRIEV